MASSLSMMRMQLSEDPDDFTWGRWYWCQPGAKRLDVPTTYGHPLWETDDNYDRGEIGFTLDGNVYARSRVSPFPGRDRDGEASWYLRGLPRDQRIVRPVYSLCGAVGWQSDLGLGVGVVTAEPDGTLIVGGGGEGGGGPMFTAGCPFYYGSCVHVHGGGEGGGPIVLGGYPGMGVGGGGEGGGPIAMAGPSSLSVGGGGEGGGPIASVSGYEMELGGGGEGGGPIAMAGASSLSVGGGGEGGGPIAMESMAPPIFRVGAVVQNADSGEAIAIPTGTQDGDTVYVLLSIAGEVTDLNAGSSGYSIPITLPVGGGPRTGFVLLRVWHTGDPTTLAPTWSGGETGRSVAAAVQIGSGALTWGDPLYGTGTTMTAGGPVSANPHALVLSYWYGAATIASGSAPLGYTPFEADEFDRQVDGFYDEDVAGGDSGTITLAQLASDEWYAFYFTIDPE